MLDPEQLPGAKVDEEITALDELSAERDQKYIDKDTYIGRGGQKYIDRDTYIGRVAQEADRDSIRPLPSDDELTSSLTGLSWIQEQKQMICEQLLPAISLYQPERAKDIMDMMLQMSRG
eukprot:12350304-Heterocapsa_arctica.AAC.1